MKKNMIKMAAMLCVTIGISACNSEKVNEIAKEEKTMEAKNLDAKTLQMQYDIHANAFSKNLSDISDAEANQRIAGANSLVWIVGHTLDIQYNLAMLTGQASENPYAEQFGFGKPFQPEATYPTIQQMIADWEGLTSKISDALGGMDEAKLNAEAPFPIPIAEQSMRGLFAFQMHHLGYEFGQIGLYRKFLGKSSFSY